MEEVQVKFYQYIETWDDFDDLSREYHRYKICIVLNTFFHLYNKIHAIKVANS